MATEEQQISLPSLVIILVVGALAVRYLFFSPSGSSSPRTGQQNREAVLRSREAAVERIQQMFPQVDRRTVLWDLQRNGGNITATTERILAGRMETVSCLLSAYLGNSCRLRIGHLINEINSLRYRSNHHPRRGRPLETPRLRSRGRQRNSRRSPRSLT